MAFHPELPDGCSEVHARLGFLSIVTHPHPDMVTTATAPDVVGHLKPTIVIVSITECKLK